jgi:PiT family inorganic phosphate transporter
MRTLGLVILVVVALGFDFTNGFHDAANAVATSIVTRALRPLTALGLAAALNVVGALVSTKVAQTVGSGIITPPSGHAGLVVVFAALIGAILWNLFTWRLGLPSSSTHALIGGLVGAAIFSAGTVQWHGLVTMARSTRCWNSSRSAEARAIGTTVPLLPVRYPGEGLTAR